MMGHAIIGKREFFQGINWVRPDDVCAFELPSGGSCSCLGTILLLVWDCGGVCLGNCILVD